MTAGRCGSALQARCKPTQRSSSPTSAATSWWRSMLELEGLRVGYGRIEVVHGVDLSVGEGEAVGMIGPNGAGKSTILRAVFGLVRPTAGRAVFGDRVLTG